MISVIVPAYNSEKMISASLNALISQTIHPLEYEVIVVDDGSKDRTAEIVQSFKNVRLIQQENKGPAEARNNGSIYAKGDILLFTDSDCVPKKNWIEEMIRPFETEQKIVGVKGAYLTNQKEIVSRFVQQEYESKYEYMLKNKYIDFIDTYSAAFKRDVFRKFRGYDTEFPVACAEDVELSYRISKKGYKMVFNPKAVVYHTHPNTIRSYLRKKYKFAFWRIVALNKNPHKFTKDSHTPQLMKFQLFFPALILVLLFLSLLNKSYIPLMLLGVLFFVLTTVPFLRMTFRKNEILGYLLPFLLFLRASAQLIGVTRGFLYLIKNKGRKV